MQKRLKIVSLLLVLAMAFALFAGCADPKKPDGGEGNAPVITVATDAQIPETAYVGQVISLPTATSTNAADGSAITVGVRVTTTRSNGNSGTAMTEQAATTVRTFTVPSGVTECQVIYTAQDRGTGLSGTKTFIIKVEEDDIAPVITLASEEAITGTSAGGITLPQATVTDAPLNQDITATALRVNVAKTDGSASNNVTSYATQGVKLHLPAGNYTATYTAEDVAGNAAEAKSVSITVTDTEQRYTGNLLSTSSVMIGNDASFNSRGELLVGKTSATAQDGDNSTATLAGYKFEEGEYVSTVFTIDAASDAPETYYFINYVASRNYNSLIPDGSEGNNPPRIVLRFSVINTMVLLDGASQAGGSAYSSATYRDGKVHVMYMQVLRYVGEERATDQAYDVANARIVFNVWFDTTPDNDPTMSAFVTCAESTNVSGSGELVASEFKTLWENPHGFLNFGAHSEAKTQAGVWNDDALHIRGIYAYEEGETEFRDTTPPTITVSSAPKAIAVVDEAYALPAATATDGATNPSVLVHIYDAERQLVGTVEDLSEAKSYTFEEAGTYYISYESADEANNINWVEYSVNVLEFADDDDPVITVSAEEISGKVGDAIQLPTVSVTDESDPNGITLGLTISGPKSYDNYFVNGQLTTFTTATAGTYTLTYWAVDTSGNRGEKVVTLTVNHVATGNVLTEAAEVRNNGYWMYTTEEVYRQKVSMFLNTYISADGWNVMMQLAGGDNSNPEWPNGVILAITDGLLQLRVGGWGGNRYGYFESWTGWNEYKADNTYVKFEYQLTDVTIEEVDYLLVQIWVNGVQLRASIDNDSDWGSILGEEGGILIPKESYASAYAHSLGSGRLHLSAKSDFGGPENHAYIAALRLDGTSVEESDLPSGCVWNKDVHPAMPAGGAGVTDTEETTVVEQNSDNFTMLEGTARSLSENALQSVTLKLQFSQAWSSATKVNARIRLLGTGADGIDLVIGDNSYGYGYATIQAGGTIVAWVREQSGTTGGSGADTAYLSAFKGTDAFYLNVAVSYVKNTDGTLSAINIALKFSTNGTDWETLYLYRTGSTGAVSDFEGVDGWMNDYSYATQGYAPSLNVYPWLLGSDAGLTDGGLGVQMLGEGTLSVLSVKAEEVTVE